MSLPLLSIMRCLVACAGLVLATSCHGSEDAMLDMGDRMLSGVWSSVAPGIVGSYDQACLTHPGERLVPIVVSKAGVIEPGKFKLSLQGAKEWNLARLTRHYQAAAPGPVLLLTVALREDVKVAAVLELTTAQIHLQGKHLSTDTLCASTVPDGQFALLHKSLVQTLSKLIGATPQTLACRPSTRRNIKAAKVNPIDGTVTVDGARVISMKGDAEALDYSDAWLRYEAQTERGWVRLRFDKGGKLQFVSVDDDECGERIYR